MLELFAFLSLWGVILISFLNSLWSGTTSLSSTSTATATATFTFLDFPFSLGTSPSTLRSLTSFSISLIFYYNPSLLFFGPGSSSLSPSTSFLRVLVTFYKKVKATLFWTASCAFLAFVVAYSDTCCSKSRIFFVLKSLFRSLMPAEISSIAFFVF